MGVPLSAKSRIMRIEVRPINRKRWHGKTGSESFTSPLRLQALVDTDTLQYATGLTPDDIKFLQKKHNVIVDLSPNYTKDTPHPFWDSSQAVVTLEDNTMFFDTDNWLDFIRVKIMKASKYVANSQKEYEEGLWPEATHVIFDEREEIEAKASLVAIRNQCTIAMSKKAKGEKLQAILILTGRNLKGMSDDHIEVEIASLIQNEPRKVQAFLQSKPEDNLVKALVKEALLKNVLQRRSGKIFYYDSMLGLSEEEVADYLMKAENQDFKIRLQAAIS